jgi:hypothetical protein
VPATGGAWPIHRLIVVERALPTTAWDYFIVVLYGVLALITGIHMSIKPSFFFCAEYTILVAATIHIALLVGADLRRHYRKRIRERQVAMEEAKVFLCCC